MPKPNVTVHHSGSKNSKCISVANNAWGYALKDGNSWVVYRNDCASAVAFSDAVRGIEFAVMGLL